MIFPARLQDWCYIRFYRCRHESSERSREWSELTQQVNSRAGREASASASQLHSGASERFSKLSPALLG